MKKQSNVQKSNQRTSDERFRRVLQTALIEKLGSNPAYSIRAFAASLKIDPGTLSQILRGRRALSLGKQKAILNRLKLSPDQIEELTTEENPDSKARQVTMDAFYIIADWYHYAILELTRVKGFRSDPRWVSQKLGISVSEVQVAVERLMRLDYLSVSEDGSWKDTSGFLSTIGHEFTNSALKRMQNQLLTKAIHSLENDDFNVRDISSLTVAIDSNRFGELKSLIKQFRGEFNAAAEDQVPDEVYNLSISFFPLSKSKIKENL